MDITNLLIQLGLDENEAKAYLTMLKAGKLTYGKLAERAKLNRATTYAVAKRLIALGLITEDTASPVATLVALTPRSISRMVAREREVVDRKADLAASTIKQLLDISESAPYSLPQTVLVTEDKIEAYLYESSKRWAHEVRTTDGKWWGFQDASFVEHYGHWVTWFWKQPYSKGIEGRIITNATQAEEQTAASSSPDRKVQTVTETTITGSQWANGNSILLINTTAERHYLTEIIDPIIAANTREMFRMLWELREKELVN